MDRAQAPMPFSDPMLFYSDLNIPLQKHPQSSKINVRQACKFSIPRNVSPRSNFLKQKQASGKSPTGQKKLGEKGRNTHAAPDPSPPRYPIYIYKIHMPRLRPHMISSQTTNFSSEFIFHQFGCLDSGLLVPDHLNLKIPNRPVASKCKEFFKIHHQCI